MTSHAKTFLVVFVRTAERTASELACEQEKRIPRIALPLVTILLSVLPALDPDPLVIYRI